MRVFYCNGQLSKIRYKERAVRRKRSVVEEPGTTVRYSKKGNVTVSVIKKMGT